MRKYERILTQEPSWADQKFKAIQDALRRKDETMPEWVKALEKKVLTEVQRELSDLRKEQNVVREELRQFQEFLRERCDDARRERNEIKSLIARPWWKKIIGR